MLSFIECHEDMCTAEAVFVSRQSKKAVCSAHAAESGCDLPDNHGLVKLSKLNYDEIQQIIQQYDAAEPEAPVTCTRSEAEAPKTKAIYQCTSTLTGHRREINCVAWCSDGRRIVTGSKDRTVKVWDTLSGQRVRNLYFGTGRVTSVSWNLNGSLVVSGSEDRTLQIWKVAPGRCMQTLQGHGSKVNKVDWNGISNEIASASSDLTVKIWDGYTGLCKKTLKGHQNCVSSVNWIDSFSLVSGCWDARVYLWDVRLPGPVCHLEGHSKRVTCVAAKHDKVASGSQDTTAIIWDLVTRTSLSILEAHSGEVTSLSWTGDSRRLATSSCDMSVKLWDAGTSVCFDTLTAHKSDVTEIAWSDDGEHLVTVSNDREVKIWQSKWPKFQYTLWESEGQEVRSGISQSVGSCLSCYSTF